MITKLLLAIPVLVATNCGHYLDIARENAFRDFVRKKTEFFDYLQPSQHVRGFVLAFSADGIVIRTQNGHQHSFLTGKILKSAPHIGKYVPAHSYSLADLKVGDEVIIFYFTCNNVDYAELLCIRRRPGGRVPMAPGEDSTFRYAWHERCNAHQDFEEKGIPLPEKYTRFKNLGKWNGMPVPAEWMDKKTLPTPRPLLPNDIIQ